MAQPLSERGSGGCKSLSIAWDDFYLFIYFFICTLSALTAGLSMLDGNSCSNSHFNLEDPRVGGTCNLCCFFQFWKQRSQASLVIGTVEIDNKEGRAIWGMTWPFVKIKESKGNSKIYSLITHLFCLPLLMISPWRHNEHGSAKESTKPQCLEEPLALQRQCFCLAEINVFW